MDNIEDQVKFFVVEFDEFTEENFPVIDLVPRSWVVSTTTGLRCQYPNASPSKIQKWVKNQKEPRSNWMDYAVVRIIFEAHDYEQGFRRLKRCLKNIETAPSTDTDNDETTLTLLDSVSEKQLLSYLNKENPLPVNDSLHLSNILGDTQGMPSPNKNRSINCDRVLSDGNGNSKRNENDDLKRHIDEKLNEIKRDLMRAIDSAKRSLQYDLDKKIVEINNNIMFSSKSALKHGSEARKVITTALPINNLEDFLKFDKSLQDENAETKSALIILLKSSVAGITSIQKDIGIMVSTIMSKAVQIKYSGCGRKVKNAETKLNFSATLTFECMKEILREKYSDGPELVGLSTKLSRWFAGAGDREGGRRERTNQLPTPTTEPVATSDIE
ncbi:uncharacterized protein [Venturia canescens]|uniref:uncharacterized protein n=1 Tax=Venturia canescens TaxID=32260 RepID=UPI001C9D6313|nr:uncharacterized protein LOC122408656 isoform X1 [Venturia canescens]XP_043275173.1 uncharacterized protein LOC122410799 [Venturia canescens]XP_043281907.1 uncharacterized protein LOC122414572 isoform X1 [Venturia canescens]XP_043282375.1 uncharacterized protein LOC122414837 [Venturia canescens]